MVCRATGGEDYFSALHPAQPDQTQERKWQRSVSRQDRSPESAHYLIIVARRLIVKHTPYETCANVRKFETTKPASVDSGTSHSQRGQMRSPGRVGVNLQPLGLPIRPVRNTARIERTAMFLHLDESLSSATSIQPMQFSADQRRTAWFVRVLCTFVPEKVESNGLLIDLRSLVPIHITRSKESRVVNRARGCA